MRIGAGVSAAQGGNVKIRNPREFVRDIEGLPTLPNLYTRFRQKIYDPKSSANDIAEIISADQAIVSNILKIANSAFYGFSRRISSVTHAIVIIGFNGIHHIVLNTTVVKMFSGQTQGGFDLSRIWEHSLGTAAIAKYIAKKKEQKNFEEVFTAGLLHDIGKVIVFKYLPDEFRAVMERVREENIPIKEAEAREVGVDHTEIGKCLLEEWKFPESLVRAAAYHDNPVLAKEKKTEVSIVHLANVITRAFEIGSGGDDLISPCNEDAWNHLGFALEDLDDIAAHVDEALRECAVFKDLMG
ncbi:MAG: HDOD domain-containing protein [Candidatus Omnitrophica bacterium]|nr:HDOD domain-containing protein [Candidatus Omnitrophota bacterium]